METKFNFNSHIALWPHHTCVTVLSEGNTATCRFNIYDDNLEEAVISDLYVVVSERHKGLGLKILNHCIDMAKNKFHCTTVSLSSDNDDWVREWYKRLGFEVESSQVWLKKEI